MNARNIVVVLSVLLSAPVSLPSAAEDGDRFPQGATFTTLITTPLNIEGMTGDNQGNLYAPGRALVAGAACPVWRVNWSSSVSSPHRVRPACASLWASRLTGPANCL